MLTTKPTLEQQLQLLLDRLQEIESGETDVLVRLETCVKACEESLQLLRKLVTDHSFPDTATEIYFFKTVKPAIMARCIFYQKLFHLHTGYYKGSGILEKERLNQVLHEADQFLSDNKRWHDYYRIGDTHYDELFYVRGRYDWKICPGINDADPIFSTSMDRKMADILAHELLLRYIDRQLNPPLLSRHSGILAEPSPALRCTATPTELVELGYALYASGFFNHGQASIKDVMQHLSDAFGVDLRKYYHTFGQIRERKGSPAKFLDELKKQLLRYIDQVED